MSQYDLLIAGSGFVGSIVARLAASHGKKVLLFERRAHTGGNMYDYRTEGILVQKYGPHVFHTYNAQVRKFLSGLWHWDEFTLKTRASIKDKLTPCPFNFKTVDDFYSAEDAETVKSHLQEYYGNVETVSIVEMLECDDTVVREYANFLFENDYRPYTAKQWGISPKEIDISVLKRVPVRLSYIDRYFDDPWQVLPQGGYTVFFDKLLESSDIEVHLNEDILTHLTLEENGGMFFDGAEISMPVLYTGPLDELFDCCLGKLPYRSVRFDFQTLPVNSYQETPCVVHPTADALTRVTEYTKLSLPERGGGYNHTVICREYPAEYGSEDGKEPYYPILTKHSQDIAERYKLLARKYQNLYLCGRLADFCYYNMDQAVAKSLDLYGILKL
jgi:UDP-galactopyranose mutase